MGAWQEIVDYTVPSNTTSVVLNSFGTITKDDFVKVVATFANATSTFNAIDLFFNTSTSQANYSNQRLGGSGTTASAFRSSRARICGNGASQTTSIFAYIKLSENNVSNIFSTDNGQIGSSVVLDFHYTTSSGATFTSGITSLTFTGNQTNGIGTGSRIQIYKLAAEKVADITVSSNTTQVDISSLSIDKDSEYLLVSDFNTPNVTSNRVDLFPNDLLNEEYERQGIFANGTTGSAARANRLQIGDLIANRQSLVYSFIKLSNIGAIINQSYGIREIGTSSLQISNHYGSSVSEAITSITKLNIRAATANAIGVGSRFHLYKLYE